MASRFVMTLFVSVLICLQFSIATAKPKTVDAVDQLGESVPLEALEDADDLYDAEDGYALEPAYRLQRRGFLHSGRLGKRGFLVSSRLGKRGFLHSFRLGK